MYFYSFLTEVVYVKDCRDWLNIVEKDLPRHQAIWDANNLMDIIDLKAKFLSVRVSRDWRYKDFLKSTAKIGKFNFWTQMVRNFTWEHGIFIDYHNIEAQAISRPSLYQRYAEAHREWQELPPVLGFLGVVRPPLLTYYASLLTSKDRQMSARNLVWSHPLWKVFTSEHVCLYAVAWMRTMYSKYKMYRPSDTVLDAWEKLQVETFIAIFGTRRDTEEFFEHIRICQELAWERLPVIWRHKHLGQIRTGRRDFEPIIGNPAGFDAPRGAHFLPYNPWHGEVLPFFAYAKALI